MTFEEMYQLLPGNGWLTKDEAQLIYRVMLLVNGPVLEVGAYEGRSTSLLAYCSKGHTVHTVDPFKGFNDQDMDGKRTKAAFNKNIDDRNLLHVHLHEMKIEDWQPRPVKLAYLDGDHTYTGTKTQLRKALECKPEHILVHDVNDTGDGLHIKKACIETLGHYNQRVDRLAWWDLQ